MKRIVLFLAVLLTLAGCAAKEPTQEEVNAAMDMAIQVYYAGTFAAQYDQSFPGLEVVRNEETQDIDITIDKIVLKDFYEEFFIESEPPCSTLSGTITITTAGTTGNLKLKDGAVKTLEFSNTDGVKIKANGYEFNGITD